MTEDGAEAVLGLGDRGARRHHDNSPASAAARDEGRDHAERYKCDRAPVNGLDAPVKGLRRGTCRASLSEGEALPEGQCWLEWRAEKGSRHYQPRHLQSGGTLRRGDVRSAAEVWLLIASSTNLVSRITEQVCYSASLEVAHALQDLWIGAFDIDVLDLLRERGAQRLNILSG